MASSGSSSISADCFCSGFEITCHLGIIQLHFLFSVLTELLVLAPGFLGLCSELAAPWLASQAQQSDHQSQGVREHHIMQLLVILPAVKLSLALGISKSL